MATHFCNSAGEGGRCSICYGLPDPSNYQPTPTERGFMDEARECYLKLLDDLVAVKDGKCRREDIDGAKYIAATIRAAVEEAEAEIFQVIKGWISGGLAVSTTHLIVILKKDAERREAERTRYTKLREEHEALGARLVKAKRRNNAQMAEHERLREAAELCVHKIEQTLEGQYPEGQALEAALEFTKTVLSEVRNDS